MVPEASRRRTRREIGTDPARRRGTLRESFRTRIDRGGWRRPAPAGCPVRAWPFDRVPILAAWKSGTGAGGSRGRRRSSRSQPASHACSGSSARSWSRTTSAPAARSTRSRSRSRFPNLVRALVADAALSGAFVPVFSELLEKGERARAWRVASTLFWLLLLGLSAVTAVFILLAPLIVPPMTDAYDDLAVTLSQILFPIVVLLGVFGVVVGVLNSYEQFTIPALTPVFWNLAIIAGLVIGVPRADSADAELYVYAGSIVVATLVQLLLPHSLAARAGRRPAPRVRRSRSGRAPRLRAHGAGHARARADQRQRGDRDDLRRQADRSDASRRTRSTRRSASTCCPQGMFSVAVATVLFPTLSRLAARADIDGFRDTVSLGLRQIAFLLVPAGVASAVLAEPIVRLLYQRGEFGPDQTPVVAGALAAFSLGLVFNGMMLMLNRGFFSLQPPWTPTWVALGTLVAERRALRRASTASGRGGSRWRSRSRTSWARPRCSSCCAAGSDGLEFGADCADAHPRHARLGRRSPPSPTPSGGSSTTRSAARSARRLLSVGHGARRGRGRVPDFLPFAGSS